jgi:hypothetical protein
MKSPTCDIHAPALIEDVEKLVCREAGGRREVEVAARARRRSPVRTARRSAGGKPGNVSEDFGAPASFW